MKTKIAITILLSSAFLCFGCCSKQPKIEDSQSATTVKLPNMGDPCAGFSGIKCALGLECYLTDEEQKMDDSMGVCRKMRKLLSPRPLLS